LARALKAVIASSIASFSAFFRVSGDWLHDEAGNAQRCLQLPEQLGQRAGRRPTPATIRSASASDSIFPDFA
jgi:hypothetical protein